MRTVLNSAHRGALAKFRRGTAPIAIETGHYNGVNINCRKCFSCRDVVEDEMHVLLHCTEYNTLRDELLIEAEQISENFTDLSDTNKISFLLTNMSIVKASVKTCSQILNKRRNLLSS